MAFPFRKVTKKFFAFYKNAVALEAFKEGKLGVFDYYKLQNIVADTSMRQSFSVDKNDDKE